MADEQAAMDQVGRYWDAVARGDGASGLPLDPALARTIHRVHGLAATPSAEARERVWQSVLANAEAARRQDEGSLPRALVPNGRAVDAPGVGIPERAPGARRRWFLAQLATAALILLTLIGSFMVFGPGRVSRQEEPPVFIPAIEATPATPEAIEAPVAEFLWATEGGPDLPFGDPYFLTLDPEGNLWIPDGLNGRFQIFSPDGEFIESWGAPGSAEGEFDFRGGTSGFGALVFDDEGNFYVADHGNARVQKFGPDRQLITTWGGRGEGDGQFFAPLGIALDDQGLVYVTDGSGHNVQVFDADGNFVRTWGGFGVGEGQMSNTHGIAIGPDGSVWVADFGNGRVQRFSPTGDVLAVWDGASNGGEEFRSPANVVLDGKGRVYVVEWTGNRVQIFSEAGDFITSWGAWGADPGELSGPLGLAFDGRGRAYISEDGNDRVQAFRLLLPDAAEDADAAATPGATTGAIAEVVWETRGGPDLPLSYPGHLALDPEGNLWIPDSGNDRYQIFSPDGEFIEVWGETGSGEGQFEFEMDLFHSSAIAFASDGSFYVTDPGNFRVQKFGPDRAFVTAWGEEGSGAGQFDLINGIAVDGQGRVYVTDDGRSDVQVFDADGAYLMTIGERGFNDGQFMFSVGSAVAVDGAGNILVSDSSNGRIQTFSPNGEFLSMLAGGPREDELQQPNQLVIDGEGRIFAASPPLRQVQVFAADGTYLGAIGAANPTAWAEGPIPGGEFLTPTGVALDGDGNIYVADYEDYRVQKFRLLPPFAPAAGSPEAAPATAETQAAELVWQTTGGPDLPLDGPYKPAIDPAGNLWVPDGRNHRFQIFSPDGAFLEAWGTAGSGDGQFDFELGVFGYGTVVWDADGAFYVADTGNHRIQKFAPDRTFLAAWGSEGMDDGQFMRLEDLGLDGEGRLFASDSGREDVQVFDRDGALLDRWGGAEDAQVQFVGPGGLFVDGDGNLYVSEYDGHRIQKIAPDGEPIAAWGAYGREAGQFINPADVAVDAQGRVYVTEIGNDRVQVFDANGEFLAVWGDEAWAGDDLFATPNGVALDGAGAVYVSDDERNAVFKFRLLPPLAP